jgi:hypothetical protein
MCYEFDGLVLFTDMDGNNLDETVAAAKAASRRPLKLKPYPQDFQAWLRAAAQRYPSEDWSTKSRFPWREVLLSRRAVETYLNALLAAECEDDDNTKKPPMPETDFAQLVAAELECTTLVHGSNAYHFNGIKWQKIDKENGMHHVVKHTAARIFRSKGDKACVKHGKWKFQTDGLTLPFVKLRHFLTTIRNEVVSDLHVMSLPEFDARPNLLTGSNGKTVNCQTSTITDTHYSTYITKCLSWPLAEWSHPRRAEYRALVKDIIAFWKKAPRPDLQIVRGEPAEDDDEDKEPEIICFGNPELQQRARTIFGTVEYLRLRLQACRGNVDLCIYKEQWIARLLASVQHICEILYTFGPPGSGKDVDALFVQEFLGTEFCATLPTNDVIKLPGQQERGVEGSTPSMAALVGKKAGLVPEVPEGEFAWHRLKHFVEQQGIRPNTRANREAPTSDRPTYGILLWSNYAPNMGGAEGAARRTAVVKLDARYGEKESEEDGQYVDDLALKYRIIQGEFRIDMLWTALAWIPALYTYSTAIPKPHAVRIQSALAAPDPLKVWAENNL